MHTPLVYDVDGPVRLLRRIKTGDSLELPLSSALVDMHINLVKDAASCHLDTAAPTGAPHALRVGGNGTLGIPFDPLL